MSTVSMQLNDKNSSRESKNIDSCHSKEYTENNISQLPYLSNTVGAWSESRYECFDMMRLRGSSNFVGVASISFRFSIY